MIFSLGYMVMAPTPAELSISFGDDSPQEKMKLMPSFFLYACICSGLIFMYFKEKEANNMLQVEELSFGTSILFPLFYFFHLLIGAPISDGIMALHFFALCMFICKILLLNFSFYRFLQ